MYTWKCHKETSCVAILNNVIFFSFSKSETKRAKQVLSGGVGTSGWGRRWGKDEGG
jgi:hypothetical protein